MKQRSSTFLYSVLSFGFAFLYLPIFLSISAYSQQSNTLYMMHDVPQSNLLNPAVQLNCKLFIGVPQPGRRTDRGRRVRLACGDLELYIPINLLSHCLLLYCNLFF